MLHLRIILLRLMIEFPHFKSAHPLDLGHMPGMHIHAILVFYILFDISIR